MNMNEVSNLRSMIDGELNRIAISSNIKEIDKMYEFLKTNIEKYYHFNRYERFQIIKKNNEKSDAKTICFTGRIGCLNDYRNRENDCNAFVNRLQNMLIPYIEQGYTNFISGGDQGVDQLAFWAVAGLKKQGHDLINAVYIPFEEQEIEWHEKGMFSQAEYRKMLRMADETMYLYRKDERFDVYEAVSKRNQLMCNKADLLIGVYDGDYKNDKNHTAECLRYADQIGLEKQIICFRA